jgi:hypothetical protein
MITKLDYLYNLWGFIVWFLVACINLFWVGAFLNCELNLFHDLIEEGKKEFANNCNLVRGFLNSVWLPKFNSFSSRIKGSKHPIKNFRNCAVKKLHRFFANFCHEIVCENDQTYIFRFVRYLSTFFHTYLPINIHFQLVIITNVSILSQWQDGGTKCTLYWFVKKNNCHMKSQWNRHVV